MSPRQASRSAATSAPSRLGDVRRASWPDTDRAGRLVEIDVRAANRYEDHRHGEGNDHDESPHAPLGGRQAGQQAVPYPRAAPRSCREHRRRDRGDCQADRCKHDFGAALGAAKTSPVRDASGYEDCKKRGRERVAHPIRHGRAVRARPDARGSQSSASSCGFSPSSSVQVSRACQALSQLIEGGQLELRPALASSQATFARDAYIILIRGDNRRHTDDHPERSLQQHRFRVKRNKLMVRQPNASRLAFDQYPYPKFSAICRSLH